MSSRPYFRFFPTDFMGDTRRLTAEERGAYIALLCELWVSGGHIPLDHVELARAAGVTPRRWPRVWEKLGRYFSTDGGYIASERLLAELRNVDHVSEIRKQVSRRGVEAKALKRKKVA